MSSAATRRYVAHVDGACSGNPGSTGIGAVVFGPDGTVVAEISQAGGFGTNNTAEYGALIAVLRWAHDNGRKALTVRSDSRLVVNQVRGRWKVKDATMRRLHREARELAAGLPYFAIKWVRRNRNRRADALAKRGAA